MTKRCVTSSFVLLLPLLGGASCIADREFDEESQSDGATTAAAQDGTTASTGWGTADGDGSDTWWSGADSEPPGYPDSGDNILIIETPQGRVHLWANIQNDGGLVSGTMQPTAWADPSGPLLWWQAGVPAEIGVYSPLKDNTVGLAADLQLPPDTTFFTEPTLANLLFTLSFHEDGVLCGTVSDESGDVFDEAPFVAWPIHAVDDPLQPLVCSAP